MSVQPTQPQTIGGVLDTTFQLYKASVGKVWPLCLLGAIAGTLPSIYLVLKGGTASTDPLAAFGLMASPGYWLNYIVTLALSLWSMGAVYLKIHAIGTDEELSLGQALQASLSRVPLLFLTTVLFGIALIIGLVLLLVPGLILMVSLMLCFNLSLLERKSPIDSLTGSHKLVWGNWWRTTAILTVGFIIIMVIYMAVGLVLGVAIPLVGLGADDPMMFGLISGVVIGIFAGLIVTPFYVSLAMAVYWDLKLRKEGGDLAARVDALGVA